MLNKEIGFVKTNWREIIESWKNDNSKRWEKLNKHLEESKEEFEGHLKMFPPVESIFKCFNYFDIEKTRVVILGQDPYHGDGQAIGLCFGVNQECKTPPSLRNINKELIDDIGKSIEDRKSLEHWAEQGILMLNASLTVIEKCPGKHMKYWKEFTKYIIDIVNKKCKGVVFLAWGSFAHKKMLDVDLSKNKLIVSSHPSPLSCNRKYKQYPAFKGSRPFSEINKYLDINIEW